MVTPLIAVRGSLVDISAPAIRAVSISIALVMVAAFAPPAGEPTGGPPVVASERSAENRAEQIRDFVRSQPRRDTAVRTTAAQPQASISAGYYDVCGDADGGPVDLRRTQVTHDDGTERYTFRTIACETWTLADLAEQMFVWELYALDGRGDGPDYAVAMYVDTDGLLSVHVLRLPSGHPDHWVTTHYGQAFRSDDHDIFAEFGDHALDQEWLFEFELLLIDADGLVVDALPEFYERRLLFPFSCDIHVASAATVITDPGRVDDVIVAARAAGLHLSGSAPRSGVLEFRRISDAELDILRRLPGVRAADRPILLEHQGVELEPDDHDFAEQWALRAINAPAGWPITTASDARLAIIDDGVDARRIDLEGRVGEGYDVVNHRRISAGVSSDRGGHGTSVAAVAAATGNDGHGIAGVDWGVEVVPYRVTDAANCFPDGVVATAIEQAVDDGVDVVNLSLGTTHESDALAAAVADAEDQGVTVVAAAGNWGQEGNEPGYPASYDSVIGVGATTRDDTIASYSNTGPSVHLVAPGGDGSGTVGGDILTLGERGSFTTEAGTSLSAPHVAAAASLYLWLRPDATPQEVRDALAETAVDLGPPGRDDTYGHGLLDVHALLRHAGGFARIQGRDRVATAVAVSQWAFETADAVIVASAANFPDALAGGSLAGVLDAPVLLTRHDTLDDRVVAEIRRLGADEAWIVGGAAALSQEVEDDLATRTDIPEDSVHRLWGEDRWETSAAIAQEVIDRTDPTDAVIAIGGDYPDALSASAYAADLGVPILLVRGDRLPDAAAGVLASRSWERITAVGGAAVLPSSVFDAAREAAGVEDTPRDRLAGGGRFETSVEVHEARESRTGVAAADILLATGRNWPDALAAGPAAAQRGAGFLLSPPEDMTGSATEGWVAANRSRLEHGWISGGPSAVSLDVARQAAAALR